MKLNERQRRFADEYIRLGNATQAYLNAYQNVKREETASASGSALLRNPKVKTYIDARLDELKKESIAEQDEILQFFTSVLRGEAKGRLKVGVGGGAEEVIDEEPSLQERIKAAEQLGKRYAMWTEKQQVENITPVFVNNVPLDD